MQDALLGIGIPLWVLHHTSAPVSVVAALTIVNTATVVCLQIRLSRGTDTVRGAARAQRRAGLALLVACSAYALSAGASPVTAVVALVAGAFAHAVGEIFQSAGAWGIVYELADRDAVGQYQGLYNTGVSAAAILAPGIVTVLLVDVGRAGWFVLAAMFLLSGVLVVPLAGGRRPVGRHRRRAVPVGRHRRSKARRGAQSPIPRTNPSRSRFVTVRF
jgi:MFS family permease